jgi:histidinol-phosphate aminotransferase
VNPPKPLPNLASIEIYKPGRPIEEVQRELGIRQVIKLASNENPLGPSPKALAATRRALASGHRYPEGSAPELRASLAKVWKLDPGQFVFGNGSNEILILAAQAYAGEGDEVVYSARSFAVYRSAALQARARPVEVPSPHFTHDLAALVRRARSPRVKLVFLCNPNNPTGSWHPASAIEKALRAIPSRCLVALDEAYAEYAGATPRQARGWLRQFPNLLVCRTFSKAYGLAGWRIGYGVANPPVAQALEKLRQPFNVNRLALAAAQAALGDQAFLKKSLAVNQAGLAQIQGYFRQAKIWYLPSKANFIFFKTPMAVPRQGWFEFLQAGGVIVRPMEPGYLRVTVGTRTENQKFIGLIRKGMGE